METAKVHEVILANVRRMVKDKGQHEEVIQRVWLSLLEKGTLNKIPESKAQSWLGWVVKNQVTDALRRRDYIFKRVDRDVCEEDLVTGKEPGDEIPQLIPAQARSSASAEMTNIIIKWLYYGLTVTEIAREMGISPQAVSKRISKIREAFAEEAELTIPKPIPRVARPPAATIKEFILRHPMKPAAKVVELGKVKGFDFVENTVYWARGRNGKKSRHFRTLRARRETPEIPFENIYT